MSVDLLSCPFCGSVAVHFDSEVWGADCRNCGACGPEPTNVSAGSTLWNTRAPDPAVAVLEAEVARLREALDVLLSAASRRDYDWSGFEGEVRLAIRKANWTSTTEKEAG